MNEHSKQMQPALIYSARVMETGDHFKNGASLKSQISKEHNIKKNNG
jgi:hypothetical protein